MQSDHFPSENKSMTLIFPSYRIMRIVNEDVIPEQGTFARHSNEAAPDFENSEKKVNEREV